MRLTFTFLMMAVLSSTALADEKNDDSPIVSGEDEYAWHCSACHGHDADGDGPLAEILIKRPPDLRLIAERNGGKFPYDRVFEIVAGRKDVKGHATFQMPKYWQRFQQMEGKRGFESAEKRIHVLVRYLDRIQQR